MPVLANLRAWLFPATVFLVMVGYVPGVLSVSTVGRWAVIMLAGLPVFLTSAGLLLGRGPVVFLLRALLGWVLVSLLWSASFWDTLGSLLHWSALIGLGMLASRIEDRSRIWLALAVGVAVSLPFALFQAAGSVPVWSVGLMGFNGNVGLFLASNVLAEVATAVMFLMLAEKRWVLAVGPMLCAVLSLRFEVLLMLVSGLSRRLLFVLLGWALIGAAMLFFTTWPDVSSFAPSSFQHRLGIWTETIREVRLQGFGLGTYGSLLPHNIFAHNELYQGMFELGIGVVFAVGLVICAFLAPVTSRNMGERCALSALCASAFVWAPLQDPATAAIFSLLVGALLGDYNRARDASLSKRADNSDDALRAELVTAGALRAAPSHDIPLAVRPKLTTGS